MSVNDARGPSIDGITTKTKAAGVASVVGSPRLAHRGCNTRKGAVAPIVHWPAELFVIDPGDDPSNLRLELARMGVQTGGILVTHCDVDHIAVARHQQRRRRHRPG